MTTEVKELLADVKIANPDGTPTLELIEIIQRLVDAKRDHETRITTLEP
tara:strand:- start:718 stop:864 length:147 start_codon:yes stop_codon:yes gene_type:complete